MEEWCAAELRSIDFYLANSEERLLKVVARLEKLGKDKIERIQQKRLQQQNIKRKNGPFKKCEIAWSFLLEIQTIKNRKNHGAGSEMEI